MITPHHISVVNIKKEWTDSVLHSRIAIVHDIPHWSDVFYEDAATTQHCLPGGKLNL